jgi:LPS-assembly lipoprotein
MAHRPLALQRAAHHIGPMIGTGLSAWRCGVVRFRPRIAPLFAPKNRAGIFDFSRNSAGKYDPIAERRGGGGQTGFVRPSRWVFRPLAALACTVLLSACGLHPLYANTALDPHVGPTLANVYVEPISDRVGYELRNNLLDLFDATGDPAGASYRLKLTISEMEEAVVLQTNTAITRYNYTLAAHYELIPHEGTVAVKTGDVSALSAYNVAAAPFLYATVTAERDAKNRAASEIAERIRTQLAVYLRNAATQAQR